MLVVLVDDLDRQAADLAAEMIERELERVAHVVADRGDRAAERADEADLDGLLLGERGRRCRAPQTATVPKSNSLHVDLSSKTLESWGDLSGSVPRAKSPPGRGLSPLRTAALALPRGSGSKAFIRLQFLDRRDARMHELTGRTHWHEPTGINRAGFGEFGRPKTPYDLFMESEGIPIFRDIGVSKVQNLPLAPWKRLGGKGTYIQLHGTEGKWGCYVVEVPGAGALNAEKHLYEEIYLRRRGPRHDRGLARQRQQAPRVRMAEGLAVLDSGERLASHRQCQLVAGAAARRHDGAEPDEPDQQRRRDVQLPLRVPRPLQRRRRFLQVQGRHRARSGARARHAAHQFHSRRRQLRPAARQPALARLAARRAVHDRQHVLSLDRPARERPLFQGARAHLGGGADLPQGQGLHLYLAGARTA